MDRLQLMLVPGLTMTHSLWLPPDHNDLRILGSLDQNARLMPSATDNGKQTNKNLREKKCWRCDKCATFCAFTFYMIQCCCFFVPSPTSFDCVPFHTFGKLKLYMLLISNIVCTGMFSHPGIFNIWHSHCTNENILVKAGAHKQVLLQQTGVADPCRPTVTKSNANSVGTQCIQMKPPFLAKGRILRTHSYFFIY